jgi:hypothetical protein
MFQRIESLLNLLFGCPHRRTTFPMTPTGKSAAPVAYGKVRGETYVVCLDCGKELAYNWDEMRVGGPVPERGPATEVQPSFR